MSARCLVQHVVRDGETVRRILVFSNADEDRVAKCKSAFGIEGSFALEALDVEFSEYVRVNDSDLIANGSKLLLVPVKPVKVDAAESHVSQGHVDEDSLSTASTVPVMELTSSTAAAEPCFFELPALNEGLSIM